MWLPSMTMLDIFNDVRTVARPSHNPTDWHWRRHWKHFSR